MCRLAPLERIIMPPPCLPHGCQKSAEGSGSVTREPATSNNEDNESKEAEVAAPCKTHHCEDETTSGFPCYPAWKILGVAGLVNLMGVIRLKWNREQRLLYVLQILYWLSAWAAVFMRQRRLNAEKRLFRIEQRPCSCTQSDDEEKTVEDKASPDIGVDHLCDWFLDKSLAITSSICLLASTGVIAELCSTSCEDGHAGLLAFNVLLLPNWCIHAHWIMHRNSTPLNILLTMRKAENTRSNRKLSYTEAMESESIEEVAPLKEQPNLSISDKGFLSDSSWIVLTESEEDTASSLSAISVDSRLLL